MKRLRRTSKKPENAVIYTRVSTKEQTQNLSLDTQEKQCRDYCQRHGLKVVKLFREEGESAKTADRTELNKLRNFCFDNKNEIDVVVVYSVNRLARDQKDHFEVRAFLSKLNINLRSATEPIDETPEGMFVEGVMSACAQYDNMNRAKRTTTGMKQAIAFGRWPFQVPLGYLRPLQKKRPGLRIDPERGHLINLAFELYATGQYSKAKVLRKINTLGLKSKMGKPVSTQSFDSILRNPIYAGWCEVESWDIREKIIIEPLISQDTFDRVQSVLSGKKSSFKNYQAKHPNFPLRRFVKCQFCGTPFTGSPSKGRKKSYSYYRCHNSQCHAVRSIPKNKLERQFIEMLNSLCPKKAFVDLFGEILRDVWKRRKLEKYDQQRRLKKLESSLRDDEERLLDLLMKERIDDETYQKRLKTIRADKASILEEQRQLNTDDLDFEPVLAFAKKMLNGAAGMWKQFDVDLKLRLQEAIFPNGLKFDGENFGTAETSIVFSLLEGEKGLNKKMATPTGFEPVLPA